MDTRLSELAYSGDVASLAALIKDNPLSLDMSSLSDNNNTLHIAAIAGQVEFAREILRLKPELAGDLNQDGFTPLHIASAKGDVLMVKEILTRGSQLCLVKGKEGRIPLHCAAIKGRVHVMEELLSARPDSVQEVTARGETAVHLAVRNSQFEAFRVLVEQLKKSSREGVLNRKDSQGNTALHIAAARDDYEVIWFMVSGFLEEDLIEVNARNGAGLTALDMLFLPAKEARDAEIIAMLMRYGATKATASDVTPAPAQSQGEPSAGPKLFEYFRFKKERDSPGEVRSVLLVMAALILTATYQAVLQPPGGLWQDDTDMHSAGQSVLGTKNIIAYFIFVLSNSIGFSSSFTMIIVLTAGFPLSLELRIAMFMLVASYYVVITSYSPNMDIAILVYIIYLGPWIVVLFLTGILLNRHRSK